MWFVGWGSAWFVYSIDYLVGEGGRVGRVLSMWVRKQVWWKSKTANIEFHPGSGVMFRHQRVARVSGIVQIILIDTLSGFLPHMEEDPSSGTSNSQERQATEGDSDGNHLWWIPGLVAILLTIVCWRARWSRRDSRQDWWQWTWNCRDSHRTCWKALWLNGGGFRSHRIETISDLNDLWPKRSPT